VRSPYQAEDLKMAILMGDLRAALGNADASEEHANKAATEVATL
jgi:hypothetical protein